MKLASFSVSGIRRVGVVVDGGVVDVERHVPCVPDTLTELIEHWDLFRHILVGLPTTSDFAMSEVTLHAPIAKPGKVMAIGLNYFEHAKELGVAPPTEQQWFSKPWTTINDPYAAIQLPIVSSCLDYEVELVMVIGKRGRHFSRGEARRAVFGYCVGNDVSVRDWQQKTTQVTIGKSFDTHAPIGPWITTADEFGEPGTASLRSYVNGNLRQNSPISDMIFDCFSQVETLSKVMTLEPGDLIFTGTPSGVAFGNKRYPYLSVGDKVRVEIDRIGSMEGVIQREELNETARSAV